MKYFFITSAFIGNTISIIINYPIHLKKRFYKNTRGLFLCAVISLLLYSIYSLYLAITSNSFFYLLSAFLFLLFILYLGIYLTYKNSNSYFNLKRYINDKPKFYSESINVFNEVTSKKSSVTESNICSEIKIDEKTIVDNSVSAFVEIIKKTSLYTQSSHNFKIDNYVDIIKEKDSNLTELRAVQFIIVLYIKEYLDENLNAQNFKELMEEFNSFFKIKNKGKEQSLSSSNWNNFLTDFRFSYKDSEFYKEVLNEYKFHRNL